MRWMSSTSGALATRLRQWVVAVAAAGIVTATWAPPVTARPSKRQQRTALAVAKRARAAVKGGRYIAAIVMFEEALKLHPGHPAYLYGLARSAHLGGQLAKAKRYYLEFLTESPDHRKRTDVERYLEEVMVALADKGAAASEPDEPEPQPPTGGRRSGKKDAARIARLLELAESAKKPQLRVLYLRKLVALAPKNPRHRARLAQAQREARGSSAPSQAASPAAAGPGEGVARSGPARSKIAQGGQGVAVQGTPQLATTWRTIAGWSAAAVGVIGVGAGGLLLSSTLADKTTFEQEPDAGLSKTETSAEVAQGIVADRAAEIESRLQRDGIIIGVGAAVGIVGAVLLLTQPGDGRTAIYPTTGRPGLMLVAKF